VLVQGGDHLRVLALGFCQLVLCLLKLHAQEFDFLIAHGDGLLGVVVSLQLSLDTGLDLLLESFKQLTLTLQVRLSMLQFNCQLLLVLLLESTCCRLERLERSLGVAELLFQGLFHVSRFDFKFGEAGDLFAEFGL